MEEVVVDAESLSRLRHSAAHVMADAVLKLFPGTKIAIGPAIEDGFYYDFDAEVSFSSDDLIKIEKEMEKIVASNQEFVCEEITREEAKKFFEKEPYKLELIDELPEGESITIYRHGDFVDLCKGPHVERTGQIKVFKLLKVAGAYWRGSEKNKQLQRIYGTAFLTKDELKKHLAFLEEAAQRDHRRIGKDLDLYSSLDEFGAGLILWHPMGSRIRMSMENFWRETHVKHGYDLLFTPHIAKLDLWKKSGHWDFYRENMYSPMDVDNVQYELKPMNCPFHILIYQSRLRTYREFPLRWAELGTVYRYERSGVLHGLMRVRGFTQDDAHIFCRPDQLSAEIERVIGFCLYVLKRFGFSEYDIYLSTKPEKYVGEDSDWELATKALEGALNKLGIKFTVDPGEGVFYGPKIDIKIKDSLGRAWQCSTIQVDFNLPARYKMEFASSDGGRERPIMIHRALMGSLERFFGILIEHYKGAFPVWLAPQQVAVLSISENQFDYANEVKDALLRAGVRAELDDRNEKLGYKIREATMKKIPYIVVIGEKEVTEKVLSVRSRDAGQLGNLPIDKLIERIEEESRTPVYNF
ncbi:MAG: threonine--tRNA ligase [Pseudomonadota bacterium]